jgi:GNAT superfamily N-acetyltransferase
MMFEEVHHRSPEDHETGDNSYREWVRRMMKEKLLIGFLVLADNKKPVAGGCLWLKEAQPSPGFPGGRVPYLMSMYTEPGFRGRGFATMIVKEAMKWARRNGYRMMLLHASKMGRPIYAKLGWKRTREMRVALDEEKERN